MRKSLKSLIAASAVVAALTIAPALHAEDSQGSGMDPGMMGQGGMMDMMGQMGEMMESCTKMMQSHMSDQGGGHPSHQGSENAPVEPDRNG